MGFRFRKSLNLGGGFKINFSKSGIGYSAGGKGFRVTKTAKGTTRTTASIPGSGLSYVTESGKGKRKSKPASYSSSELPQIKDYSDSAAPRSSKYYDFRYYSLKFCPIPLIIFFIFIVIFGLSGDLVNNNGVAVSGLAAIPGITVFIIGWFIIFHIARFIFFHIPAGYNRCFKYHDKLLKFCTLAETAAKRECGKFDNEYLSSMQISEEETFEDFIEDSSESEFAKSETDSYTNYLSAVRPISNKYYSSMEQLQKDWSVLYNLKDYTNQLATKFEDDCFENISLFIELKTVLEKYKEKVPTNIPAFRRLAMLYEKQGRFEEAVNICRQACSFGMDERSRMIRMIKKAGRTPTAEEELIINNSVYLQSTAKSTCANFSQVQFFNKGKFNSLL